MAETTITQDEQKLKQRAMRRLAIALTIIAAAIVALALLDRYNASLKKSEPIPAPPRETPAPPLPPPSAQKPTPPLAEESKPPPPPHPVVSNQELPAPPATGPAPARPAEPESSAKKAPSSAAEKSAPATPAKPLAPATAEQKPIEQKPAVSAQKAMPAPAVAPQAAEAVPAPKGFLVQVGVFMTAANARALQKKLADKGIPTYTETRVVVGPFKDRAEADAVIAQLKELGVTGVVVAPPSP